MRKTNKKTGSGPALRASVVSGEWSGAARPSGEWGVERRCAPQWIGAARLSGSALRASVGNGESALPLTTHHSPLTALPSLLLAIIFCYTPASFAERADRDKPVHLEADQMLIDDAKQISTFIGNVKLIQGTLLILGDKIVVVQDQEGFKHGTAYGNTASFRQKREGLDEYVEGYGERIEYDTRAETLDLYVQARLKRDMDEVRGEHITYSANTETLQVYSGETTLESESPKRVHAVLQPKPKQERGQPAADALPIKPIEIKPRAD